MKDILKVYDTSALLSLSDNLVIDENFTHIDKYKTLVGIVQKYLNIEKECIFFYE